MNPQTIAVHGGQRSAGEKQLPVPALILNSAILLESVDEGWQMLTNETKPNIAYQRYANPTVMVLEDKFSMMEGATYALAVNSGMSACYMLFRTLLSKGDHIVAQHGLYHEISDQIIFDQKSCGVEFSLINDYSISSFEEAFKPATKMVFVESPTNPAMLDVDIASLAEICRSRNIIFVVDNTLLTHEFQKPLNLGADLTIYSTTKSINGHGDAIGGIISTNNKELYSKLKAFRDNTGMIMDPMSSWLTTRGIRTLPLRLKQHTENAFAVMDYLSKNFPEIAIRYPLNLPNSKRNRITNGGGILSIILKGREQAVQFINNLKLIKIGTTFGNLESLCYCFGAFARPHRDITKIGIPLGLVRLSIGIEDVEDIIRDIEFGLKQAGISPVESKKQSI